MVVHKTEVGERSCCAVCCICVVRYMSTYLLMNDAQAPYQTTNFHAVRKIKRDKSKKKTKNRLASNVITTNS